MKTFTFDHEPTFAELWDVCVYNLIYQVEDYKKDIEGLFQRLKLSKQSHMLDVSAGGGFPAIELLNDGYDLVCADGFEDEVELFNRKSKEAGLTAQCIKAYWKDLPNLLEGGSFDFLFCRGNSFIYADGGWNTMIEIDKGDAMNNYQDTLKVFYDLLKPGGWLYIDKFKDEETTHREKVCEIKISEERPEELIFWTERFSEQKLRRASMLRKKADGTEAGTPNVSYDLTFPELIPMLETVGFSNIEKVSFPSEKVFGILIAQK